MAIRALDALEISSGTIFGLEAHTTSPGSSATDPTAALVAAVTLAVSRPPCHVTFSGGRDSSVVLAAAVQAARSHGVPDPIPVTLRFPGDPLSLEDDYQRLVLKELDLSDSIVLEPGTDLDVLGAFSTELGRRHGPLFPFNAHFAGYMLRHCGSGTLLTGLGGDEVMTPHPLIEVARMATAKRPPSLALARSYGASRYPKRAGRYLNAFRRPWLTAHAIEAHTDRLITEVEQWRLHAGNHLRHVAARSRWLALAVDSMNRIAGGFGMTIEHPLLEHGVVEALARQRGFAGGASRAETTRHAFSGLLPPALIERTTKASFSEVFWTDLARSAWRDLPFDRIDQNLVDIDRLAEEWSKNTPIPNSYLLAQYLAGLRC